MEEYNSSSARPTDALFLERLDAFCRAEVKSFAERESRPVDEIRRCVAEWHGQYLFQPQLSESLASAQERICRIQTVLEETSRMLESLRAVSGVHSFILAVDPTDSEHPGFLGGSVEGREFWRGQRGGGDAGAKTFKAYCAKHLPEPGSSAAASAHPTHQSARSVKTELYDKFRTALRSVSGVRNAEMKWSNPSQLETYGVRLVGWPASIPSQNPSSLKANQNKELLDALKSGAIHFARILSGVEYAHDRETIATDEEPSFEWAIQYDHSRPSPDDALDPDVAQTNKRRRIDDEVAYA